MNKKFIQLLVVPSQLRWLTQLVLPDMALNDHVIALIEGFVGMAGVDDTMIQVMLKKQLIFSLAFLFFLGYKSRLVLA